MPATIEKRGEHRRAEFRRVRSAVALLLLVGGGLAALPPTIAMSRKLVAEAPDEGDYLSRFALRLEPVRAQLRSEYARVGYLPRMALRSDPLGIKSDAHFLWTRYSLAPVQVVPTWRTAVVFFDRRAENDPQATVPDGLRVERDFGDGVLLLRPPSGTTTSDAR